MRARQESVDETRLRITEAAVRLHERVGPSATTVSAIAEEAGVTRLTVYRHFPDEATLVGACSAHWRSLHPRPDPDGWASVSDPVDRLRTGLAETYAWCSSAAPMMTMIERDLDTLPASVRDNIRRDAEARVRVLVSPFQVRGAARRRVTAAVSHALQLSTWQSLCVRGRLTADEAIELMVAAVLRAAG